MADLSAYLGTPRWVKVSGIIAFVLVILGFVGFVGVAHFHPDSIGGLVSEMPLWVTVSGIIALLPVLHIAIAPVLHALVLLLVSLAATLLGVYKRRGMTPYRRRKQHQQSRSHR